eukprot:2993452-Pyramimonas_sp.AAC.1
MALLVASRSEPSPPLRAIVRRNIGNWAASRRRYSRVIAEGHQFNTLHCRRVTRASDPANKTAATAGKIRSCSFEAALTVFNHSLQTSSKIMRWERILTVPAFNTLFWRYQGMPAFAIAVSLPHATLLRGVATL